MKNSKNTISNSSIHVGGHLHIGDIINLHLREGVPANDISFSKENAAQIKTLVSKGEMEKAIDLLLGYAKSIDVDIFNELISIARQWEELQRDVRIGVLSSDEKFRLASKITFSLLASTDALQRKTH